MQITWGNIFGVFKFDQLSSILNKMVPESFS